MSFTTKIITWLASRIKVDDAQVINLKKKLLEKSSRTDEIFYVLRRPSYLEAALLQRVCMHYGLPVPKNLVLPKSVMKEGHVGCGILSLRNRRGYELSVKQTQRYRRQCTSLLKRLPFRAETEDVKLIPAAFFAGLGPKPWPRAIRWLPDYRFLPLADLWMFFVFLLHRNELTCDLGPSISIKERVSDGEMIRRLFQELYRKEKLARGAQTKTSAAVEGMVLSGEQFERVMLERARETGFSRDYLYRQAQSIVHEMAATMRSATIGAFRFILRPLVKTVFSRIKIVHLDHLRQVVAKSPTLLLPSHRSHFDYLLMSYILYFEKMPLPYVAAGINLNFWPVGGFFRKAGGFFIRREIGDDRLYKVILQNYLTCLVKQGQLLQFFIEGGRSRSGGMRVPRLGLLKYLVQGWEQGGRKDLCIVPVGITYERVAEEDAIVRESTGQKKEKESFFSFLKLRKIFSKRFGSVVVVFGQPFSLRTFKDLTQPDTVGGDTDVAKLTEDVGFAVAREIMDCAALTATSLCAAAVFSSPNREVLSEDLTGRMSALFQVYAFTRGYTKASEWEPSSRLCAETELLEECSQRVCVGGTLREQLEQESLLSAMTKILGYVASFGYLNIDHGANDGRISLSVRQRSKLAYYNNASLHFFLIPALVAEAAESEDHSFVRTLFHLHRIFQPLFLLPEWAIWCRDVERFVRSASDAAWLEASSDVNLLSVSYEMESVVELTERGKTLLSPLCILFREYLETLSSVISLLLEENKLPGDTVARRELVGIKHAKLFGGPENESPSISSIEFAFTCLEVRGLFRLGIEESEDTFMRQRDELQKMQDFLQQQLGVSKNGPLLA